MAVPQWTQNSGYKLGTLQERVTTSITLPIAPGSASGTGFDPAQTSVSLPAQGRIQNSTTISITKTWTQGGVATTYTYPISVRIPTIPALTNKRVPVAILLHGDGGNGANEINDWQNYLGDHILIAPTGYNNAWNVAHETTKAPDIEFLKDLITHLKFYSNVDSGKIRLVGFSNGAALANRAYVEIDDVALDSICTIGSQFFDPMFRNDTFYIPSGETGITSAEYNTAKTPIKPRRFLNIQGTADATIPYAGGAHAFGYSFLEAQDSVYQVAKSQGYTGAIIPDAGGIFYGVSGTYYYSYLAGSVIHYKTSAGHSVEDYMRTIVGNYLGYTTTSAPDIFLEFGSVTEINLNTDIITLISGELPPGMRLQDNKIVGTPFEVSRDTDYEFVLRAKNNDGTRDRTYKIEIQGPDKPVWTTNAGKLPLGPNNSFYILDNSIVDFQLSAIDADLPTGQNLEYFISDGDGTLPPGITLTTDGKLVGIVDPIMALDERSGNGYYDMAQYDSFAFDFGMRSANGFESYYYDTQGYDYAIPTQSPKKLNRIYEFTVSVSDGDTIEERKFQIFLVGDDFLRADNTIMQIGTGLFTADNTYLRTPLWLTPADLGYKRANNYVTIFLETYVSETLVGVMSYELQATNDDGSASTIPPGMVIDPTTGEIAGRVPYMPAVTKEYKFTVSAKRYTSISKESLIAEKQKTFTVKILGEVESTITWNTPAALGSINANFISTFSVNATTTVSDSSLLYDITAGTLPPGLILNYNGEIVGKVRQFASGTLLGLTTIDDNSFSMDGGTTTTDRKFKFTIRARDRFGFSATTREFNIVVSDPDNVTYSNLYVKPLLKSTQRSAYSNFIGDPNVFTPSSIYRPNDPEFGLQKEVKMLVYSGLETKEIREYIAATRLNHKRKRFKMGSIKTATAKKAGTTTSIYEVVYVEVIDPVDVTSGVTKVRSKDTIINPKKLTVDSVEYETSDDASKEGSGLAVFMVTNSIGQTILVRALGNDVAIMARNGGSIVIDADGIINVTTRTGAELQAAQIATTSSDPFRFRPNDTPIKVSSNAVKISDPNSQTRYISNITNMRANLSQVGVTEQNFLPLWMSTAQSNTVEELGYVTAIPLCYCKPGTSAQILLNIQNNGFDFRQLDFEIDRYVIDNTKGNSNEQYIPFGNYSFNV
jgi:poly(3-hydroxybutyrate) depolymerase|tara:strand:- start:3399 stop:6890 length:3492 start_codon:yes stop_codon:yes gene_type:complete